MPAVRDSDKINERNYTSWLARGRTHHVMCFKTMFGLMEQVSGINGLIFQISKLWGWCRAELWCHLLSNKKDTSVIVVHSTKDRLHTDVERCAMQCTSRHWPFICTGASRLGLVCKNSVSWMWTRPGGEVYVSHGLAVQPCLRWRIHCWRRSRSCGSPGRSSSRT